MTHDKAASSAQQNTETDPKQSAETQVPVAETQTLVNFEAPALNGEILSPQSTSNAMIQYSPVRQELAAATTIPEIKTIHDKSATLRDHARRAQDRALFDEATEVLLEAQRLIGQQLIDMAARGERASGHGDQKSEFRNGTPKLEDLGITKKQSSEWQASARMSKDEFKTLVKYRKTSVAVVLGLEEVQFPRAATKKADADTKSETAPEPSVDPAAVDGKTTAQAIIDKPKSKKLPSHASKTKTSQGMSSKSNGSLSLKPLPYKEFYERLRGVGKRLMSHANEKNSSIPGADLMDHLNTLRAEFNSLVDRGYTH
jgi:hypothetical protein